MAGGRRAWVPAARLPGDGDFILHMPLRRHFQTSKRNPRWMPVRRSCRMRSRLTDTATRTCIPSPSMPCPRNLRHKWLGSPRRLCSQQGTALIGLGDLQPVTSLHADFNDDEVLIAFGKSAVVCCCRTASRRGSAWRCTLLTAAPGAGDIPYANRTTMLVCSQCCRATASPLWSVPRPSIRTCTRSESS